MLSLASRETMILSVACLVRIIDFLSTLSLTAFLVCWLKYRISGRSQGSLAEYLILFAVR